MLQKTLEREGSLEGIGLHSGEKTRVVFKPAETGAGYRFFKNNKPVPLGRPGVSRQTSVGEGSEKIMTVEHALAAAAGLGLTNMEIHVTGPELPALDGSAIEFVRCFKKAGLVSQDKPAEVYAIKDPVFCFEEKKAAAIFPSATFEISYLLDYPQAALAGQAVSFRITPEIFEKEIAPARTFCTAAEAESIRKAGFGKGASAENNLIIGEKGPENGKLRFEDECARHKVLDIIGDLALLGFAVQGRIHAIRSGHALNRALAGEIFKRRQ